MAQLISSAANSSYVEFDTSIPSLTESADIVEAFRLYHYGKANYITNEEPGEKSIYAHFEKISNDIEFINATPTGGGVVQTDVPHQLQVLSTSLNIPEGFVWVDSDSPGLSVISSGAGTLTNDMPAVSGASAHGVIWVDKDYTLTDPFNPSSFITTETIGQQLAPYLTIASASATYAKIITSISSSASTSYTLQLTDSSKLLEFSAGTAIAVTVPAESTTNFPVGSSIAIMQTGAGQITVSGAGGVTINGTPGFKTRTQWSLITLIKRGINLWVLLGDSAL